MLAESARSIEEIAVADLLADIAVSLEPIALLVSDDGPGIPDYAIDRIFERFYSLPRPETGRKSTGLGLPFVKEVMELHGGCCEVTRKG